IRPPGPGLKYERMVSGSTRRLPSTTIELTVCATAGPEEARVTQPAPTRIPPRIRQLRASPPTLLTLSPIRYAPFFFRPPPSGPGWHRRAFYSVFFAPQTKLPAKFPFSL